MKKKFIITGLATATLLTAASLTDFISNVSAEETVTEITKADIEEYFTGLENDAVEAINKNDKITDKAKAIEEAKQAIGKEDLLTAIDNKEITPAEIMNDLAKAYENDSTEEKPDTKPQTVANAKQAPGEEGKLSESTPVNGGIPKEIKDKIIKRIEEEKVDVNDANERVAAATKDVKDAEEKLAKATEKLKNAKTDEEKALANKEVEEAKKELESYKKDLVIEEKRLKEISDDIAIEKLQNMVANLEKEESKLENELKVASERGAKESVITDLLNKIRKNNEELKKAKTELNIALYGIEALVNNKPEYNFEEATELSIPMTGTPESTQNPEPTPGTPAPAQTPAATPAAEVQATPAEATSAEAAPTAVAAQEAQTEESKKEELPNTGTAELGLFTPAVLSILAGLGLTFGKKEDK